MAKKTVAVYDGSEGYIKQLLEYLSRKKDLWFEVKGFSDPNALERYLNDTPVDVLLFSMEDVVEEGGDPERKYERFIFHKNAKQFIYFGERRNSKSRLPHISKYQSVERILAQLSELVFSKEERKDMAEEWEQTKRAELVCVYMPAPEPALTAASLKLAEVLAPELKTLFIELDRYSIIPYMTGVGESSALSDLIYLYQTNPQKMRSYLSENRNTFKRVDILSISSELADVDEIPEEEWPEFIQKLAGCGGYESVVLNMAEAFRRPEILFEAADVIYVPIDPGNAAAYKVSRFAKYLLDKGLDALLDKVRLMSAKSSDEEPGVIEGEIGWI